MYYNNYGYPVQQMYYPTYRNQRDVQRLNLSTTTVSPTNLGGGFVSYKWDTNIASDQYLVCFLSATGLKVINAGWSPSEYSPLYALESYPRNIDQWVITIYNPPESSARSLSLYLIAKK